MELFGEHFPLSVRFVLYAKNDVCLCVFEEVGILEIFGHAKMDLPIAIESKVTFWTEKWTVYGTEFVYPVKHPTDDCKILQLFKGDRGKLWVGCIWYVWVIGTAPSKPTLFCFVSPNAFHLLFLCNILTYIRVCVRFVFSVLIVVFWLRDECLNEATVMTMEAFVEFAPLFCWKSNSHSTRSTYYVIAHYDKMHEHNFWLLISLAEIT